MQLKKRPKTGIVHTFQDTDSDVFIFDTVENVLRRMTAEPACLAGCLREKRAKDSLMLLSAVQYTN